MNHQYENLNKIFPQITKNNQIHLRFHPNILEQVKEATNFLGEEASNSERIYCIKNYIYERPLCKSCGKELKYNTKTISYPTFCSRKCANSNKEGIELKKRIFIEKYGVDNPMKNESIKQKSISNNDLKLCYDKMKSTMEDRYGTSKTMHIEQVKQKVKHTIQDRYNVDNVMKLEVNKDKIRNTVLVNSYDDIINRVGFLERVTPLFSKEEYKGRFGSNKYKCNLCNYVFEDWIDSTYKFIPRCPKCFPKKTSIFEEEIYQFINTSLNGKYTIIRNDRSIIDGLELDICIPELKLAIEANGLLWHSEFKIKDKNYHLNKLKRCNKLGIKLIQIFEDEWMYKRDIVKDILKHNLGLNSTINHSKCTISSISIKDKDDFLTDNHILGKDSSNINIGLFYNSNLISIMTFRRLKGKNDYIINRYTNKLGIEVEGGFRNLLDYAISTYNMANIISSVDLRWSLGSIYRKNGFTIRCRTNPSYYYIKRSGKPLRINKNDIKEKDGYLKIYDCGNIIYEYKANQQPE